MPGNHYKVFFTISFFYQLDIKKKVSKSFKSDLDINNILLRCTLNDTNVRKKWLQFVLKAPIDQLNPSSNYDNNLISERKITTHRIVNLMSLTEIH